FSSRRRHTRSKRDWSSDVCSSDLGGSSGGSSSGSTSGTGTATATTSPVIPNIPVAQTQVYVVSDTTLPFTVKRGSAYCFKMTVKIGRASCRERGCVEVGGVVGKRQ